MVEIEWAGDQPQPKVTPPDGPTWAAVEFLDKEFHFVRPSSPPHELATAVRVVNRLTGEERRMAVRRAVNADTSVDDAKVLNRIYLEQVFVSDLNAD